MTAHGDLNERRWSRRHRVLAVGLLLAAASVAYGLWHREHSPQRIAERLRSQGAIVRMKTVEHGPFMGWLNETLNRHWPRGSSSGSIGTVRVVFAPEDRIPPRQELWVVELSGQPQKVRCKNKGGYGRFLMARRESNGIHSLQRRWTTRSSQRAIPARGTERTPFYKVRFARSHPSLLMRRLTFGSCAIYFYWLVKIALQALARTCIERLTSRFFALTPIQREHLIRQKRGFCGETGFLNPN